MWQSYNLRKFELLTNIHCKFMFERTSCITNKIHSCNNITSITSLWEFYCHKTADAIRSITNNIPEISHKDFIFLNKL